MEMTNKFAKLLVCLPSEYTFVLRIMSAMMGLRRHAIGSFGFWQSVVLGKWRRRRNFSSLFKRPTDKTICYKQILMMTFERKGDSMRWGLKKRRVICGNDTSEQREDEREKNQVKVSALIWMKGFCVRRNCFILIIIIYRRLDPLW